MNLRIGICLLTVLVLSAASAFSQQRQCAFDAIHKALLAHDPSYRNILLKNEAAVQQYLHGNDAAKLDAFVYRIPVVVHVIHLGEPENTGSNISDEQIQSAISALSDRFRGILGNSPDAEIEFQLAGLDPSCSPTNGIERIDGSFVPGFAGSGLTTGSGGNELDVKNLSRWPSDRYYNIWVVPEINGNNGGAGTQGFAYLPGASPQVDGAVMLYNAFGYDPSGTLGFNLKSFTDENTVLTHEIAHALGLLHSFEGDDTNGDDIPDTCPLNSDCTSQGDLVCDTDPHQRINGDCPDPTAPNPCRGGLPLGALVHNYLSYSSEDCQDRFTDGQIARMRASLEALRPGLYSSLALNSTYPFGGFTPAVPASCIPVTGTSGLSAAFAGILNVSIAGRNFSSSNASGDNGYVNGISSCLNVVHLVAGSTNTISITVLGANEEQLRAWIDFNNDGIFDNATEQIYLNPAIPAPNEPVTVSGSFIVPAGAVTNKFLRIRIIDEVGTIFGFSIPDACYNPEYGQGEDYAVVITGILPVQLREFKGRWELNEVVLDWITASESQSKEFVIERSDDGNRYNTIGSVAASGQTTAEHHYAFTDKLPGSINYYRLRMKDQDGSSKLSPVVVIRRQGKQQEVCVTENPFNQNISLQFEIPPGRIQLQLLNAAGLLVEEKELTVPSPRLTWWPKRNLAAGVYFLRIITSTKVHTFKLVRE